jgi:DNA-binding phage protein
MTEQVSDSDPAGLLSSTEAVAVFLSDAFETGDASHVASALRVAVRAAQENRVVEAASPPLCDLDLDDLPLATVLSVTKAIGVCLVVAPAGPAPDKPRRILMADLLAGAERLPEIYEGVADALDGPPIGRELG